jgi:hypothetical protein
VNFVDTTVCSNVLVCDAAVAALAVGIEQYY